MEVISFEQLAREPAQSAEVADAQPAVAVAPPQRWPQDAQGFKTLVDAYLDALVRYAFRRLGSRQDAEDVVQDVMVRAYLAREEHRDVVQVGPYLYRMTSNACTDVLRQRRRRVSWLSMLLSFGAVVSREPVSPSDAAKASEEALRAERLLSQLPKAQAEVVRLRVFGELSLTEIADVVGCSVNTANSRLRYGFKKLRRIVSKESKP